MALEGAGSPPVVRSTSYSFLRNRTMGIATGRGFPDRANRIRNRH